MFTLHLFKRSNCILDVCFSLRFEIKLYTWHRAGLCCLHNFKWINYLLIFQPSTLTFSTTPMRVSSFFPLAGITTKKMFLLSSKLKLVTPMRMKVAVFSLLTSDHFFLIHLALWTLDSPVSFILVKLSKFMKCAKEKIYSCLIFFVFRFLHQTKFHGQPCSEGHSRCRR